MGGSKYELSGEQERLTGDSIRFSRDRPRFTDTLDMIKFLCKDVWQLIFRKQIDNLKTNHRVRPSVLPPNIKAFMDSTRRCSHTILHKDEYSI